MALTQIADGEWIRTDRVVRIKAESAEAETCTVFTTLEDADLKKIEVKASGVEVVRAINEAEGEDEETD